MATPARAWRTSAARYAFAFSAAVSVVAGTVFIGQDEDLTGSQVLSSIGLNLVASVIFAVFFAFFATEKQEAALRENLEDHFRDLSGGLLDQMSESNKSFLPMMRFPSINGYGKDFNLDMERSLEQTSSFVFRGPSPRYVAARLQHSTRHPASVRVSMIDPQNNEALYKRAADRKGWPASQNKTPQQLYEEIREEILCSVVALFDYRHACPVEVSYTADPSVYRYEMFDDSVYVCWYHEQGSLGKEMPEALKFSNQSFWYKLLRMEDQRQFDLSQKKAKFDAAQDDSFLIAHLWQVTGDQPSPDDIRAWRTRYTELSADFVGFLTVL